MALQIHYIYMYLAIAGCECTLMYHEVLRLNFMIFVEFVLSLNNLCMWMYE